ncbi:hypothetical protein EDD27_2098 [Nonomuraea polychroma]|uniref:Uncharacterized protein n=2 Tax=Nonomuraea polychroma TaxID=46176 RepID=A0A438M2H1_9ACTN|nr:hypothetical protein EDD27_2098 [Nonomuraea polychroma]
MPGKSGTALLDVMNPSQVSTRTDPAEDTTQRLHAESLRQALAQEGIAADVHDGYGLALVSVWVRLVVWCDGYRFWWRTGWDPERKRAVYAWHPAIEPGRAARRVAFRYADLRANHPLSPTISDMASATSASPAGNLP